MLQSYNSYNMGWKIHVVDDMPKDIVDFTEEPYQYESWLQSQNLLDSSKGSGSSASSLTGVLLRALYVALILLLLE